VRLIEECQEELILELCDPKYSRSTLTRGLELTPKTLVTSLGTIKFKVKRVKGRRDGAYATILLDDLLYAAAIERSGVQGGCMTR